MMIRRLATGAIAAGMVIIANATFAQTPVKIGVITSLSGPGGYLGQDIRDGFQLRSIWKAASWVAFRCR